MHVHGLCIYKTGETSIYMAESNSQPTCSVYFSTLSWHLGNLPTINWFDEGPFPGKIPKQHMGMFTWRLGYKGNAWPANTWLGVCMTHKFTTYIHYILLMLFELDTLSSLYALDYSNSKLVLNVISLSSKSKNVSQCRSHAHTVFLHA